MTPCVALVHHLGLDQGQCVDGAVGRLELDAAGNRHAMPEVDGIGQEAPHLQFRADAFVQMPICLEEQPVAEQADRVAAGSQARHRHRALQRVADDPGEGIARRKAQDAAFGLQLAIGADGIDHGTAECLIGHGVGQHPGGCLLAHFGHGHGSKQARHLPFGILEGDRQGHEVAFRRRRSLDVDQGQQPLRIAGLQHRMFGNHGSRQRLRLCAVPALAQQEARQDFPFELGPGLFRHRDAPWHDTLRKKLFQPSNRTTTASSSSGARSVCHSGGSASVESRNQKKP